MNAPERNLHLKAPASGELARIVRVNEEIKAIVATAFRINLMALNAIFLAKRAGNAALGFGVTVFLGVKLATKGRVSLEDFERAVTAIPEVQVVQHVLGMFDYRLRVTARDIADFERVLRRRIMTLPGVGEVEANVLLSEERRPGPLG